MNYGIAAARDRHFLPMHNLTNETWERMRERYNLILKKLKCGT